MNKNIKKAIILTLSMMMCTIVYATKNDRAISFSQISIDEGLSQSTVFDIEQDKKGNLWIATADGLNKYDGYRFTIYRTDDNPNSIQADYIRALKMMDNDIMLIGSKSGFSVYDIRKNSFKNIMLHDEVHHISQYNDSTFYATSSTRLYRYTSTKDSLSKVYSADQLQLNVTARFGDVLLVGTNKGLYSLQENKLAAYMLPGIAIQEIKQTEDGIWIATEGEGLFFLSNAGGIKNYIPKKGDAHSLISPFVRCLELDNNNKLWVGTMDGLSIYDKQTDSFSNYNNNSTDKTTISHNSVRTMFSDNQGGVWLGTYFGGLNYYHPLQNQFGKIAHIPFTNSLSNNIISCIVEGKENELWIGTNDKGLNRYNSYTGLFNYYSTENGLLSNNIKTTLVNGNHVYVGSHSGGMACINIVTGSVKNYTKTNSALGSDDVYSMAKDNNGQIWVGTLDGLKIYNPMSDTFLNMEDIKPIGDQVLKQLKELSTNKIYALYKDSKNKIWIGTESGTYTYSLNNRLLVHYDIGSEKRHERINCFLEDGAGRIWIGTHSGLGLLDENTQKIKIYTTKHGLPNNNIYGILQDDNGSIWISTNNGLAHLSPNLEQIRQYTIKDGIQGNQFNYYAYCRTKAGEMYFGGVSGITHFFPHHLIDNPYMPQAVISELRVSDEHILPGDRTGILIKDISYTDEIILKPTENTFSLLFSVPNFLSRKHNVFAYKLEGLENDWTYTSDSHPISYSNLGAGEYIFHIKAANSDGKWNDTINSLSIKIKPYWWNTILFRLFLLAVAASILFFLLRFYKNKQSLKNQLALEKLEQQKQEEISQTKLRFFINISHEFRTPLTLILSPLKELFNKTTDRWTRNQLQITLRNANKLMYLVDQLMDYRRADLGVFALKVIKGDPSKQVDAQLEMFDRLAKQKKIDFVYENTLDRDEILYDPNYFDLILTNLLSNAFKFTEQHGAITVKTYTSQNNFILQVTDTGKGMREEVQARVFERFYQASNEVKGTGVGLSLVKRLIELHHAEIDVESKYEKGTSFTVSIPQEEKTYSKEERSQDKEEIASYGKISAEDIDLLVEPEEVDGITEIDTETNQSTTSKHKILVIEDDADVRNYLVSNLHEMAVVFKTDNGKTGLEIVNEEEIDLIITDVMLPIMDGIAFCKSIKQNIRTSHIPVIMLTAKPREEDELEGRVAGADSYISKPFDISILKVTVRNMLRSRHRMLKHYSDSLIIEPKELTFNQLDREFLENAKSIVEQNMDNISFSVDEFCKEMAMSRSNLHLKMKAITGESTVEFIRKIRFNEACNLLIDGRYSVSEVSIMVGFNTPSYFTTSFKSYFGVLPSEYARKQRGEI